MSICVVVVGPLPVGAHCDEVDVNMLDLLVFFSARCSNSLCLPLSASAGNISNKREQRSVDTRLGAGLGVLRVRLLLQSPCK